MEYELAHDPAFTIVETELDSGEDVTVEAGSMVSYTDGVEMETHTSSDGLISSVKKSVLSGEETFRNTFKAESNGEMVRFAHKQPGDMKHLKLQNETVYMQSGSYVASGGEVETDSVSGGLNSILGGKGLFFLKAEGTGDLFLGGYGGVVEQELAPGEEVTVDSGHAVAWDGDVEFDTHRVGGLKKMVWSGEGFVVTFTGPGSIYLQTRDYDAFLGEVASRIDTGD